MLLYYFVTQFGNTAFEAMQRCKIFRTEQQFLEYILHLHESNPHTQELKEYSSGELWKRTKEDGYVELSCRSGTMVFRWIETKKYKYSKVL